MCLIVSFLCVWRSLLIFSITFCVNCFSNASSFLSFFIFSRTSSKFLDFSEIFIGETIIRKFSIWLDDLSGEAVSLFWKTSSPVIVEVSSMIGCCFGMNTLNHSWRYFIHIKFYIVWTNRNHCWKFFVYFSIIYVWVKNVFTCSIITVFMKLFNMSLPVWLL